MGDGVLLLELDSFLVHDFVLNELNEFDSTSQSANLSGVFILFRIISGIVIENGHRNKISTMNIYYQAQYM